MEINHRRLPMRKIVLWIAVIAAILFIVVSITELERIAAAMSRGNWLFILLAFGLQVVCLINNSLTYQSLYRLVGLNETWRRLWLLSTASTFINMIAPSGGLVGVAVFMDAAKQRNQPTARVMVVGILYAIYEYISLLCVVALGFVALIRRHNITNGEIVSAFILLLLTLVLSLILYIGYRSQKQLGDLMYKMASLANRLTVRLIHRDLIQAEKAHSLAKDIGEGIAALRGTSRELYWPLIFALNNKLLLIGVLTSIFLSLKVPFSLGTVVAGYGIAQLFFYVTPSPAGIGFVEGLFPLTLNALNVPFSMAVLITLIYRGITLWFSFGVGFYSFRRLHRTSVENITANDRSETGNPTNPDPSAGTQ